MKLYETIYWDYGYDEWRFAVGDSGTVSYHSYPVTYSDSFEKVMDKDVWDHILWEIDFDHEKKCGVAIRIVARLSPLPPLSQRPQSITGLPWKTMQARCRMRKDWHTLPVWGESNVQQ